MTVTLCSSFPHCSRGDAVTGREAWVPLPPNSTWKPPEIPGFPTHSRRSVAVSRNSVDSLLMEDLFTPHNHDWRSSSKEGCVQMLTWGSKAVMSNRCHIGLRLGNLQSLSFLAHTFLSTKACGTQDAQIW